MCKERLTRDKERVTLGLVAGLGVGAGIFYYRSLVNAHLARAQSPSIVMVHADVQKVMGLANGRESHQLADYLVGLLDQLAGGGAQIATIPAFSPQVCAQELAERSPLSFISLLDAIVAEVSRRPLARVSIFGARVTMETVSLIACSMRWTSSLCGRKKSTASVASTRRSC